MIIYTDGSARNNQDRNNNTGGFGIVVLDDNENIIKTYSEQFSNVTNNQMEIRAILWAMENYGNSSNPPKVWTDSSYAFNTFTNWIWSWRAKGWCKSNKQEPKNMDLLLQYVDLYERYKWVTLHLLKGHAGNKYNEFADALATADNNKINKFLKSTLVNPRVDFFNFLWYNMYI